MTLSILAFDEKTGAFGGAAMTGNLCVGGWVLRGDCESGLSASQGTAPSTLWGEDVLAAMRRGQGAATAVSEITSGDAGRAHRQLAALDVAGGTGHFTGDACVEMAGVRTIPKLIAAGNMLAGAEVLDACVTGFAGASGDLPDRLLAGLSLAASAGGDSRGLSSAALLVVSRSAPPLTLRIDHSGTPLEDLGTLLRRAFDPEYVAWLKQLPTRDAPERAP